MGKLPVLSADEVIRCFEKLGYEVVRQRGSHIRLHHRYDKTKNPLTIANHKVIGKGLLRKLIRDADLSVDEFLRLLSEI